MNDHHLDPPDDQEPPEWYMTLEDVLEQMEPPGIVAEAIRKAIAEWTDAHNRDQGEPDPPYPLENRPQDGRICNCEDAPCCGCYASPLCPHGRPRHDCDSCDYLGDLAYDTARERR